MINSRPFWIVACILVLAGLAGQVQAGISLGSAQDSKYSAIEQGGEAMFRIFIFNVHQEEDLMVYLGVADGDGLSVEISPDEIVIPYTEPGRYTDSEPGFVYIGTSQGDVKARPVRVRVSAPLSAEPGRHEVIVYAATERGEGLLGTAQTRRFLFTVDVGTGEDIGIEEEELATESDEESPEEEIREEPEEPGNESKEISLEAAEDEGDSMTGLVTGVPLFGPLVLIGIIALFVALRLLKRI